MIHSFAKSPSLRQTRNLYWNLDDCTIVDLVAETWSHFPALPPLADLVLVPWPSEPRFAPGENVEIYFSRLPLDCLPNA